MGWPDRKRVEIGAVQNFINTFQKCRSKAKDISEDLLTLQQRLFGERHFRIKSAAAVAFLVAACMSTLGTLTYIGVIDQSQYEVSGLSVKQNGTGLDISWNDEGCDGYEVFIFENGERPRSIKTSTNRCRVELDELGKKYKVVVTAKGNSGGLSGAKSKKLYAEKVEQKIELPKEAFAGFEGNGTALKAKAPEAITYKSSNEKVVSVNDKGTLVYNEPGEAEIHITAEEGDKYKEGKTKVDVTVFPDQLERPVAEVSDKKDTTVIVSWAPIDFAQKYSVLKKNPADESYDVIEEIDAETCQVELPRSKATYAILASADVEGEIVESAASKEVKVKSAAEDAKAHSSYTNLKTLDHSSLELITNVNGLGSATVPQSMSFVNGNFVISYASHSGSTGALVSYDQDGNRVAEKAVSGMGHANGSTYNPNTGKIYTVRTHRAIWSPLCTTFNGEDFSDAGSFNLPKNCSGIAYDETSDKFYLSKGNELYVTDSEFNIEHYYGKKIRYNHAQDIGGSEGVMMVCTWVSGNESYIDMYRASDGAYIGGYTVPIGEIESVLLVDKHLVLLMNNSGGGNVDQLLRTVEPVSLP